MASLEEQVQQVQGFGRHGNEYVGNEQSSAISEASGKHSLTSLGPGCCPWPLLSIEALSSKKERKKEIKRSSWWTTDFLCFFLYICL